MLTLQKNKNATISDFIKTVKGYGHTSIDLKRMKQFEEDKKALTE